MLSWEGAWYLQVWRTNRLEVVTMLIYGVVWSLLEPNPGEVGCMLVWTITILQCVTQIVSGEFRSLLVVGTLTPHPGEDSYVLLWKIIVL